MLSSLCLFCLSLSLPRSLPQVLKTVTAPCCCRTNLKDNTLCTVFIVKPVFCHCLPSLLSSIPLSLSLSLPLSLSSSLSLSFSLSLWLKMNLPACAHALHHCQVPHGGPPPPSQTGHQPLAGIIPHLQNSPHCF